MMFKCSKCYYPSSSSCAYISCPFNAYIHVYISHQAFEAQPLEDLTEKTESTELGGSLGATLEGVGVVSLDTSVEPATLGDTSLDQSRGTLRGVDTTADDVELLHFSEEEEEEEEDRSLQEGKEDGSYALVISHVEYFKS